LFAEPAFSHSAVWPPPSFSGLPPEPDDPRPALSRDALLLEPHSATAEWVSGSAVLDRSAGEPLQAAKPVAPARRRAWKAAILVSCLLHAAVALALLTSADDSVNIAGSDQAGVMLLGDAADDQSASGDGIGATNVTLVTMLDPKPVATVTAEAVAEAGRVQAVEDSGQPVREIAGAQSAEATPDRVAETTVPVLQPSASATVESMREAQAAPSDPASEVLTAREPARDTVRPHVERPTIVTDKTEPEKPEKKPVAEKPARRVAKKAPAKTTKAVQKAEKAKKARKKSGSGGRNETDSRRGVADGQADGRKEVAGRGGKASSAGNAAASNYPGKVAAKLRRAVRSVSRLGGRARNDVLVSFTVDAGGGLGGLRVARSSGSRELDRTALAVVRRAAPFPPIPPESGRRNWSFTLPLGLH
jgi:protein TonB